MQKRILIKPLNNLLVRNPFTKRLIAPAGEEVLEHTYWRRLEKQGDISIHAVEFPMKEKPKAEGKK